MSTPLSPAWTQALHTATWAQGLENLVRPQTLSQRAAQAPTDSWQAAALRGASRGSAALSGPVAWSACGAALAAQAAGVATGALGAAAVAYPVARLIVGEGTTRDAPDAPAGFWSSVRASGLLGLPERAAMALAQSSALAQSPVCRSVLLGVATGLRALVQIPRALLALVSGAAALAGAAIGIVVHMLRRAYRALSRAPAKLGQIIASLEAQFRRWQQVLSLGAQCVRQAQRAAAGVSAVWQQYAAPAATFRQLMQPASYLGQMLQSTPKNACAPDTGTGPAAADSASQRTDAAWATGARACVRGAARGAQRIAQSADAIAHVMGRVKEAMVYVQGVCARVHEAHAWARAYAVVAQVQASLPRLGCNVRAAPHLAAGA